MGKNDTKADYASCEGECDGFDGGGAAGGDESHDQAIPGVAPSGSLGNCTATFGNVNLDGLQLDNARVHGYNDGTEQSDWPVTGSVALDRATSACAASSNPGGTSQACANEDLADCPDIIWSAVANGGDFLECNEEAPTSCGYGNANSCSGSYSAFIYDAPLDCYEYNPVRLNLDTRTYPNGPAAPSQADCTSGYGRFEAVPIFTGNNDDDGLHHVTLLPFQVSGSGQMTRKSWITSITVAEAPTGSTPRVIRSTAPYRFTAGDQLEDASTISTVLSGTTNFSSGELRGSSPFVAEEIAEGDLDGFAFDMTWTCSSTGATVNRPQGYQFTLADIGCPGHQRMTLRYSATPKRVMIEQYGLVGMSEVEPTTTTSDGEEFLWAWGGLTVNAAVQSATSSQAVVKLKEITWHGTGACTPGTYTFAAE